jgi:hypothetical protein
VPTAHKRRSRNDLDNENCALGAQERSANLQHLNNWNMIPKIIACPAKIQKKGIGTLIRCYPRWKLLIANRNLSTTQLVQIK